MKAKLIEKLNLVTNAIWGEGASFISFQTKASHLDGAEWFKNQFSMMELTFHMIRDQSLFSAGKYWME